MPKKILYYLGAGASAKEALPLAKSVWTNSSFIKTPIPTIPGLSYELENFDFKAFYLNGSDASIKDKNDKINLVKQNFKGLANKANEYGDVDTYAKYLNLMDPGGTEFVSLKTTLSQYFSLKQVSQNTIDKRYVPWLISLLKNRTFPDDIKILSWNYDYQVEIAASIFGDSEDITYTSTLGYKYQSSFLQSYPNLHPKFTDFAALSLMHLNGVAGFYTKGASQSGSVFQPSKKKDNASVFSYVTENDMSLNMHFAWEGGNYHSDLMNHVLQMIDHTDILVVIGYSFPFFNREVDKQVFKSLLINPGFKKIYYQDPVLNGKQLTSQFSLPHDIDIQHVSSTDNFHIPFEY